MRHTIAQTLLLSCLCSIPTLAHAADDDGDGVEDDVDNCVGVANPVAPFMVDALVVTDLGVDSRRVSAMSVVDYDGVLPRDIVLSARSSTYIYASEQAYIPQYVGVDGISQHGYHLVNDIDGDGVSEILAAEASGFFPHVFDFDSATGSFTDSFVTVSQETIVASDFDDDGDVDWVVSTADGAVIENTGDGWQLTSLPITRDPGRMPFRYINAQDLDGDGDSDFLAFNAAGEMIVWERNPDGDDPAELRRIESPGTEPIGVPAPLRFAIADLEGDGDLDVAVLDRDLRLFINDGLQFVQGGEPISIHELSTQEFDLFFGELDPSSPGAEIFLSRQGAQRYSDLDDLLTPEGETLELLPDVGDGYTTAGDMDGDGIADWVIVDGSGIRVRYAGQPDQDADGIGDVCDDDWDGDGIANDVDLDADDAFVCGDSDADLCDDCAALGVSDPDRDGPDADRDGICDLSDTDADNDGLDNDVDNCPINPNPDQADLDLNGEGDACDDDIDGDLLPNRIDLCPMLLSDVAPTADNFNFGEGAHAVAAGDIDGDGLPDMLLGNEGTGTTNAVTVWTNLGDGDFAATAVTNTLNLFALDAELGDLDRDGDLDAVVATMTGTLVLENVDGQLTRVAQLGSTETRAVALADFDEDGHLDLITANRGPDATNRLYINDGTGGFSVSAADVAAGDSFDVAVGDMNRDGHMDAVFANLDGYNVLVAGDGALSFTSTVLDDADSGSTHAVALSDFDEDSDLDLFLANALNAPSQLWKNLGSIYDIVPFSPAVSTLAVVVHDFSGDGRLDVYLGTDDPEPSQLWLNDGFGSFLQVPFEGTLTENRRAAVADFDGDGVDDLIVGNAYAPNVLYYGNGQTDIDNDGLGDRCDDDSDNDGVVDADDSDPLDPFVCQDSDNDTCDDCALGVFDPAGDGDDNDADGLCDVGDPDDDNDSVPDADDNCPFADNNDQLDNDMDGAGDACDLDDDSDAIADLVDNCPFVNNPAQADHEMDGIGDLCDPDIDNDNLTNDEEEAIGSDPFDADMDDDGVLDGDERSDEDADVEINPEDDPDGDGLPNFLDPDSDDDGILDGVEHGVTEPNPDTDESEGMYRADADPNSTTNPFSDDTDGDTLLDAAEDANQNGAVDAGETDPNAFNDTSECSNDLQCPAGWSCDGGVCVEPVTEDVGVDVGMDTADTGAPDVAEDTAADVSVTLESDDPADSGCGCASAPNGSRSAPMLLLGALLLWRRRRNRRSAA